MLYILLYKIAVSSQVDKAKTSQIVAFAAFIAIADNVASREV